MDSYVTIYDAGQEPFKYWILALPFAGIIIIDLVAFVTLWKTRCRGIKLPLMPIIMAGGPLLFATVVLSALFLKPLSEWRLYNRLLTAEKAPSVEGVITDFKPMPEGGHADESFIVGGRRFRYSSYNITSGFNKTAVRGGPLKEGMKVKIWYYDGTILKIQSETQKGSQRQKGSGLYFKCSTG